VNRSWNRKLQATVDNLEELLKKECDEYFANIKEHIFQVGKK